MPTWTELGNIWHTLKELDWRPLAEEAERPLVMAVAGATGVGKSTLIAALHRDSRTQAPTIVPTLELTLDASARARSADLIVLMLDPTRGDFAREARLFAEWQRAGRNIVVFYNKMDLLPDARLVNATMTMWVGARVAWGSAIHATSLTQNLVPRAMEALKERPLALARQYPLFRAAVVRNLINDTAFANASYALGTGVAEILPVLTVPFNVADMLILTKNQALMVYKLGLALGLPTEWQAHVAEMGSVVGAGFVWRQIARQLVGLIPGWGIVPKVAVAYAGTYAVGEAIWHWYQTGHKLSGRGLREVYAEALARGKQIAHEIVARAPQPARQVTVRFARPTLPTRRTPRAKKKDG